VFCITINTSYKDSQILTGFYIYWGHHLVLVKKKEKKPTYFKPQKQTKNTAYIKTHLILNKKPVSIRESGELVFIVIQNTSYFKEETCQYL
jgi:hypothetical protein